MRRGSQLALFGLALVATLAGCAQWAANPEEKPFQLPRPRPNLESTLLEVTFVRLPEHNQETSPKIWEAVDEQCLPAELRQRLAANGIRCGVVGVQIPKPLADLLPQAGPQETTVTDQPTTFDENHEKQSVRQLQCYRGKRAEILAGETVPKLTVLAQEEGAVRGETFVDAQCVFAVKVFPAGDGRVKLELLPEIDHGQPKQRVVSQDGAFRMLAARDQRLFESLRLELALSPGQTVVLGGLDEPKGVGAKFFTDHQESGRQRLLLVRLAQPPLDELFSSSAKSAPLASPVD